MVFIRVALVAEASTLKLGWYVWRYDLTSVGREENHPGVDPPANCDWNELAAAGFCASWLMNECGMAVSSTEKTEGLGRTAARPLATASRLDRAAGSLGRAVMPAIEALSGSISNHYGKTRYRL